MKLRKFQEWTGTTAVYPEAGKGSMVELMYLTLGLVGEIQSTINLVGDDNYIEFKSKLGNIYWYVARLGTLVDWQFEDKSESVGELFLNERDFQDRMLDCLSPMRSKACLVADLTREICRIASKTYIRDVESEGLRSEIKSQLEEIESLLKLLLADKDIRMGLSDLLDAIRTPLLNQ